MNPIDQAMSGAAMAPLTKDQRRQMMAHYVVPAFQAMKAAGLTGESLDDWRYEEQFKACHKTSLRACVQADWNPLCAHFLRIAGRRDAARSHEVRGACGQIAVARRKLSEAMTDACDVIARPRDYAISIANSKFKTRDLFALTERQTWILVFDLRRAAQRRRAGGRR